MPSSASVGSTNSESGTRTGGGAMAEDVRPEVVEALFEATVDPSLSQEHLAELLYNASPQERQAVSDLHG